MKNVVGVDEQGRILIPPKILEELNINFGDKVNLIIEDIYDVKLRIKRTSIVDDKGRILISPRILKKSNIESGDLVKLSTNNQNRILIKIAETTQIKKHLKELMKKMRETHSLILMIYNIHENMKHYKIISKRAPFFFEYTLQALYKSLVIDVCNLFDPNQNRSERGILKLLSRIEHNISDFDFDGKMIKKLRVAITVHKAEIEGNDELLEGYTEKIKGFKETIGKNKDLRDQIYAHWDKIYFDYPVKRRKIFDILVKNEMELIFTGSRILSFWCQYLKCGDYNILPYDLGDFTKLIKKININKNLR